MTGLTDEAPYLRGSNTEGSYLRRSNVGLNITMGRSNTAILYAYVVGQNEIPVKLYSFVC